MKGSLNNKWLYYRHEFHVLHFEKWGFSLIYHSHLLHSLLPSNNKRLACLILVYFYPYFNVKSMR